MPARFITSLVGAALIVFGVGHLHAGDSIAFDSTQPHRLWNTGNEPVHGIWFVMGRDG